MKHKKLKITVIALAVVLLVCCAGIGIYAADYYRMDLPAAQAMLNDDTVDVSQYTGDSDRAEFVPKQTNIGFIFYPGGKVEYTAYAPLMRALAEQGILCVIPKMPLNLAVLDMDAAEGILKLYPEIDTWYIGGHSLGGSMAASYAAESDAFRGLILLASYSTVDLSESGLQVLNIYGTEDRVLNMENFNTYSTNLPSNTVTFIIDGGNHAQFGSYGKQNGDGFASITPEKQVELAVKAISDWITE